MYAALYISASVIKVETISKTSKTSFAVITSLATSVPATDLVLSLGFSLLDCRIMSRRHVVYSLCLCPLSIMLVWFIYVIAAISSPFLLINSPLYEFTITYLYPFSC